MKLIEAPVERKGIELEICRVVEEYLYLKKDMRETPLAEVLRRSELLLCLSDEVEMGWLVELAEPCN